MGPYDIIKTFRVCVNYIVNTDGKLETPNANLLKKYVERYELHIVSVIDFDNDDTNDNQESIL